MIYRILLPLFLLFPLHDAFSAVYQCEVDGKTHFTQISCDTNDVHKGVYKPKSAILTYSPDEAHKPVRVKIKKPVNTMDAGDAIVIKQKRCEGGTYTVLMKNISKYSTYSTTVDVTFNYFKSGRGKKEWDKRKQTIVLNPREQREFVLKGREAPSSFEIECVANRTVKFVRSTMVR
jgi:hypothetical protein